MQRAIVQGNEYVRVRSSTSLAATILGVIPTGRTVEVATVLTAGGSKWAAVLLDAGNTGLMLEANTDSQTVGYMAANLLKFDTAPPPPPPPPATTVPASKLLGWNVIGNHSWAEFGYQRGCRAFTWMEGLRGAWEFKQAHPDVTVIYRKAIDNGVRFANGYALAQYVDVGAYPGLIYMGYNEADQWGQGGDDLRRRLQQDVEAAQYAKSKGVFYIAGTFSMGTPDFTNPEVCQIIREVAAPAYNSGLMGFDMHLYSPTMDHIFKPGERIWFERRWEFLFRSINGIGGCGFDPSVRNIYATEIGLDEGGVGGLKAHNVSDEWLRSWCNTWLETTRAPMLINGVSYSSPVQTGTLFQAGDGGRWAGYQVQQYTPVFEGLWR